MGSKKTSIWGVALANLLNKEMPKYRISVLPTAGAIATVKGYAVKELDGIFGAERGGGWKALTWDTNAARTSAQNIRTWGQLGVAGPLAEEAARDAPDEDAEDRHAGFERGEDERDTKPIPPGQSGEPECGGQRESVESQRHQETGGDQRLPHQRGRYSRRLKIIGATPGR